MSYSTPNHPNRKRGFTLIELLIVVAIIAILAAIAVPNFLEAQTRAKVSRTISDMRSIRVGLESYIVDNNVYPETDFGLAPLADGYRSIYRITTPISYLSSIPKSPWDEDYGGDKIATEENLYLYVRRDVTVINGAAQNDNAPVDGVDGTYFGDRVAYILQAGAAPIPPAVRDRVGGAGQWLLKSVGPDNEDDRDQQVWSDRGVGSPSMARVYDPTNGTISWGDIVIFSDRPGTGRN